MASRAQSRPPFDTLDEWLQWLTHLHPREIELGLARVQGVATSLDLHRPAPLVISIAGTNGKGSSARLMEQCLKAAGHRVGVYSSPHLLRYNERLCIQGEPIDDDSLCRAFSAIEAVRGDTSLSYFEYGTLAALLILAESGVDIAILEVGMGGRLDAVNLVDADLALITHIGLDHQEWLGHDRNTIGKEKAGIMRRGRPAICADPHAPSSIASEAKRQGAKLYQAGQDYEFSIQGNAWEWRSRGRHFSHLPLPDMPGAHFIQNAAGVLATLVQLPPDYPCKDEHFRIAINNWSLPGRCEWRTEMAFGLLLDVAHNSEAVRALAAVLTAQPCDGRTVALFAALQDKPVAEMLQIMADQVSEWHFTGLPDCSRAMSAEEILRIARNSDLCGQAHHDVAAAWKILSADLRRQDRLVVFGSFHTVEALIREIE